MVHLVPSRTNYNASQIAELVFEQIYKIHGLPQNIISDRDVLFTSTFWSRLHQLIGMKLRMLSAYHPQTDRSTEWANWTVTQMLRQCIQPDQKDWVAKLLAIEFVINSARSESTGYSPFFLNFGRMPHTMIWGSALTNEYPSIWDFGQMMTGFSLGGWILNWMVLVMTTSGLLIGLYHTTVHGLMPLSKSSGSLGMSLGSPITRSPTYKHWWITWDSWGCQK